MRIQNNVMALNTHRSYTINNDNVSKSAEKLSSGYRINRAGDDAAGLAISEKMRSQIRGLNMATKNSQDAISLVATAEGALQETHNILQRMRELSVQSASDTNETTVDRDALNKEFQQLIKEIDDTAAKTKFNDMGLIDGTFSSNIVSTSGFSADKYSAVWASSSTLSDGITEGTYAIGQRTVNVKAANDGVLSVAAEDDLTDATTNVKGTAYGAALSGFTWVAATTDESKDATLNGEWTFGFDSSAGMYTATNGTTGETRKAAVTALTKDGNNKIDFGSLGAITFTSDAVVDASAVTSFSGKILMADGETKSAAVTEDYLSFRGEEVKLEAGQNVVMFEKSGVSLNLKKAYAAGDDLKETALKITSASAKELVIQTGANKGDNLAISIDKMDAQTLGVKNATIANRLDANTAIAQVNKAVNTVSTQRAALGALSNRLDHKIANLKVTAENLTAAESRIRDVDIASEMTQFTKNNILSQAATAMLAQANSAPQNVLSLLR